nr:LysR family transcriptional regulator [Acetobacter sacchari]
MVVFARVVAEGGFSHAARSLSLTPSAISKVIARLEDRLKVRLFIRSSRAIELTPDGMNFHLAALRAIEAVESADAAVNTGALLSDTLRIRSMPTFATAQLAPLVPDFRRIHPSLKLEIHLRMEPGNLLEGGMDVAIHVGPLPDSSLVAKLFARTRWVICASPGYLSQHGTPQEPVDLAFHRCLNFLPSLAVSHWAVQASDNVARRLRIDSDVTTNQGQMLLELARADAGIVRLAAFHIHDDLASGRLVRLLPKFQCEEEDPIYACYDGHRNLSMRIKLFLSYLELYFSGEKGRWN